MASLDEIFAKEFKKMMGDLRATSGYINLTDIPVPPEMTSLMKRSHSEMVAIYPLKEQYYSRLGNTMAILWKGALRRRKFDYKGEFMKDKSGNFIFEDVTCPSDCAAVVSTISIQVPYKYKPSENMSYVDMISRTLDDGTTETYFVYILPKKYLYKVNQTALVLSWNKLRVYYSGVQLAMQNGRYLYVYIIQHKPTRNGQHNYRILMTKPSIDYDMELSMLNKYWLENNIIFNPALCELLEPVKGITNTALMELDGVIEDYVRLDPNKNLAGVEVVEDLFFDEEDENADI